ncbi:MAG: ion transporter [Bradymonadia bacterium]
MIGRASDLLIAERTVIFAILLNALTMFVAGFYSEGSPAARALDFVDVACIVYFLVEAILKIRRFTFAGYWASGLNRIDFAVLLVSMPGIVVPMAELEGLSVVLLLRMSRLVRMVRLLRFVPDLDRLLAGIRRALRASVGVFLAMSVLLFMLGMGAHHLFRDFAPEHFGDPLISLYSIFKVLTIEGWHEIPDLIASRADHVIWGTLARVYFSVAVALVGLLGLSLANAVFVDEMLADNHSDLEAKVDALTVEIRALRADVLARDASAEDQAQG